MTPLIQRAMDRGVPANCGKSPHAVDALYVNPESIVRYIVVPQALIVEAIVCRSTRAVLSFLELDVSRAREAARVELDPPPADCEVYEVAFETIAGGFVGVAVRDQADPAIVVQQLRPWLWLRQTSNKWAGAPLLCRYNGRVWDQRDVAPNRRTEPRVGEHKRQECKKHGVGQDN